jgi:hypothetical protein
MKRYEILSVRAVRFLPVVAGLVALGSSRTCLATPAEDFKRYEVILARKPFGEPPPEVQPAQPETPPPPAPPSFAKDLKLCALTEDDSQMRVGIVDTSSKPPKNYLLAIGETSDDGLQVIKADFEGETALVRKNGEEQWLYMDESAQGGSPAPAPMAGSAVRPPVAAPRPGDAGMTEGAQRLQFSYAERLRKRREELEEQRKRETEKPKLTGKELEEQLKAYQMDLIRKRVQEPGTAGPPMPIPLTKEMDDQLVSEGVLPPADDGQKVLAPASPPAPAAAPAEGAE